MHFHFARTLRSFLALSINDDKFNPQKTMVFSVGDYRQMMYTVTVEKERVAYAYFTNESV